MHCGGKLEISYSERESASVGTVLEFVREACEPMLIGRKDVQSSSSLLSNHVQMYEHVRKRVVVLNVDGLISKLKFPEFDDLHVLESRDILCLTETHLDGFDSVEVDGFTCFMKNRLLFKRKSGGIAALVRNNIAKKIKVIENIDYNKHVDTNLLNQYKFVPYPVCKDGLFLEIPRAGKENGNSPLYLCIIYIPPENSPYTNLNCFQEIEETLLHMQAEYVIIAGDLNAKTAEMRDYSEACNITDSLEGRENMINRMNALNIKLDRKSRDTNTNNLGQNMIDFCLSLARNYLF